VVPVELLGIQSLLAHFPSRHLFLRSILDFCSCHTFVQSKADHQLLPQLLAIAQCGEDRWASSIIVDSTGDVKPTNMSISSKPSKSTAGGTFDDPPAAVVSSSLSTSLSTAAWKARVNDDRGTSSTIVLVFSAIVARGTI
jgi:hypothetical protein